MKHLFIILIAALFISCGYNNESRIVSQYKFGVIVHGGGIGDMAYTTIYCDHFQMISAKEVNITVGVATYTIKSDNQITVFTNTSYMGYKN